MKIKKKSAYMVTLDYKKNLHQIQSTQKENVWYLLQKLPYKSYKLIDMARTCAYKELIINIQNSTK